MGAWSVGPCGLLGVLLAGSAQAAAITWDAPSGCVDEPAVIAEAERLIGGPLGAVASVDFDVRVTSTPEGRVELVLVQIDRTTGERRSRTLEGGSCGEVTEGASVAIALAIQGTEAPATDEGERVPAAAQTPTEASSTAAPAAPDRSRVPSRKLPSGAPLRAAVGVAALADAGSLPGLAPGALILASLGSGAIQAAAFGVVLAPLDADEGAGTFRLFAGGALGCYRREAGVARELCGGVELGSLSGEGGSVRNPRAGSALWVALRAEVGVGIPLGAGFQLAFRVGAAVPLQRPEFLLGGLELVHRPAIVAGRAAIGVDIEL